MKFDAQLKPYEGRIRRLGEAVGNRFYKNKTCEGRLQHPESASADFAFVAANLIRWAVPQPLDMPPYEGDKG